jgi:transposase
MSIYDQRTYQNKNVLENLLKDGLSVKQMSNHFHISYKLVNLWLIKHGLIVRTPEINLP